MKAKGYANKSKTKENTRLEGITERTDENVSFENHVDCFLDKLTEKEKI